jgi:hypothetical protein
MLRVYLPDESTAAGGYVPPEVRVR